MHDIQMCGETLKLEVGEMPAIRDAVLLQVWVMIGVEVVATHDVLPVRQRLVRKGIR
jgi:hypothetical protein